MAKKYDIRNTTAEFLTFVAEGKEQGIQVLYKNETVWATQKAMAQLFDCSTDNIGLHLKNIYDTNELNKEATTAKISVVQQEGAREVRRNTLFYNLDAIISVGYPDNYYPLLKTKVRTNIFIGQRMTKIIPANGRKFLKSITLFYEISSCDLFIRSAFIDSKVSLGDIL